MSPLSGPKRKSDFDAVRTTFDPETAYLGGYRDVRSAASVASLLTTDTSFSVLTGNNIETRRVKAGGVIFREGEQADELFVIKNGYVRIQIGNRTMADLTADNIFGEMALIDSEPR